MALQRSQKRLLEVGNKHGISLTFFHGRGGTVGRGAGPTHRFLEALPKGSPVGGLRITEQGEVIGQKFNTATTPPQTWKPCLPAHWVPVCFPQARTNPRQRSA